MKFSLVGNHCPKSSLDKKALIITFIRPLCNIFCWVQLQWLCKLMHCILLFICLNWERPPSSYLSDCIVGVDAMHGNETGSQHRSSPTKSPVAVHRYALTHTAHVSKQWHYFECSFNCSSFSGVAPVRLGIITIITSVVLLQVKAGCQISVGFLPPPVCKKTFRDRLHLYFHRYAFHVWG